MNIARQIWGSALCLGCAALSIALFQGSQWKVAVPLLFIAVIAVTSNRFGTASGILGSLGSALMFASFLFEPLHSLYIADEHQRQNLLVLLVGGMLLAEILGSQQRQQGQKVKHSSYVKGTTTGAEVQKRRA